ncbi:hypothetical protein [Bacillus suaedaesalsae]|uniref:Flagellar hook-length control protein-like C-terminal domain-containing protein n=1 Tax=Bacillus suaedaesalsae TaxID=2810349 RepID=A0ABS2DJ79_9BACI|nr:hypothetical protein [Bacillus suaedaesalsae]MBM6618462.1 hypothetical protein [Bacillus suaedaesalsae]
MNPIKIMQSIATSGQLQDVKGVVLKPGQLIHGRVEKLFPNNLALVRLGAMKMTAQLEAAISVMENNWFEVVGTKNGDFQLRVVKYKGNSSSQGNDAMKALLQQFHLPETKQNLQLLQFLLSKNIPFTKDHLTSASTLLKEAKDMTKGLLAIEQLIKKELPLTEGTFKAMVAVQGGKGISSELNQVSTVLNRSTIPNSESITQLKDMISKLQGELTQEQTRNSISELVKVWGSNTGSIKDSSFQLLQQLGVFPKSASINSSIQEMAKLLKLDRGDATNLDSFAKQAVMATSTQDINKIGKIMNELLQRQNNDKIERFSLLKQVIEQTVQKPVNFENSHEVKNMMKQMISSLGLEYEKSLEGVKAETVPLEKLDSLKPLLMRAINELGVPGKELEPLLHKLTGIQLQSHESNSPMQQIMMHIPLSLGTKQTELTLQWNGRKDKEGKIDPGYCRVLFYLDLQHIEETIIDMHVQNRIVSITLMNDSTGLDGIVSTFEDVLKEQLAEMNYKLSTVRVVSQMEKRESFKQELSHSINHDSYQGVDLKI